MNAAVGLEVLAGQALQHVSTGDCGGAGSIASSRQGEQEKGAGRVTAGECNGGIAPSRVPLLEP